MSGEQPNIAIVSGKCKWALSRILPHMEQGLSLERRPQGIEGRLVEAQAHALRMDEAQQLQQRIEHLKYSGEGTSDEIKELQKTLEKSIITVRTLPEFKELMQKVAISDEHIEAVLNNRKAEEHNAGYALLVMKDENGFRYRALELTTEIEQAVPQELPKPYQYTEEEQARMEELERDLKRPS